MSISQSEPLLHGFSAKADRFGITAGEVMGGGEGHIEYRILRIVRAHADRLLDMVDRLL
jgi:hypothetical protein